MALDAGAVHCIMTNAEYISVLFISTALPLNPRYPTILPTLSTIDIFYKPMNTPALEPSSSNTLVNFYKLGFKHRNSSLLWATSIK